MKNITKIFDLMMNSILVRFLITVPTVCLLLVIFFLNVIICIKDWRANIQDWGIHLGKLFKGAFLFVWEGEKSLDKIMGMVEC